MSDECPSPGLRFVPIAAFAIGLLWHKSRSGQIMVLLIVIPSGVASNTIASTNKRSFRQLSLEYLWST